jgi:hypothetical protein
MVESIHEDTCWSRENGQACEAPMALTMERWLWRPVRELEARRSVQV